MYTLQYHSAVTCHSQPPYNAELITKSANFRQKALCIVQPIVSMTLLHQHHPDLSFIRLKRFTYLSNITIHKLNMLTPQGVFTLRKLKSRTYEAFSYLSMVRRQWRFRRYLGSALVCSLFTWSETNNSDYQWTAFKGRLYRTLKSRDIDHRSWTRQYYQLYNRWSRRPQ